MNLLLVDDEPLTAKWIESVLTKASPGYSIAGIANDGKEALELISDKDVDVDVVITDIKMPEMDGLELIRQLKSLRADINILIISSHSDFRFTSEAIRLGADDYLLKSEISEEELLSSLERIRSIRSRQAPRSLSEPQIKDQVNTNANLLTSLKQLKNRSYRNKQEKDRILSDLKLEKLPVYCLLIRIVNSEELIDLNSILGLIHSNQDLLGERSAVTALESSLICITGQANSKNAAHPEKMILSGMKAIQNQLESQLSLKIQFGMSSIRSSAEDFPALFAEAESSMELHGFYSGMDNFSSRGVGLRELQNNKKDLEQMLDDMHREFNLENWKYAWKLGVKIITSMGLDKLLPPDDAREIASSLFMKLSAGDVSARDMTLISKCSSYDQLCRLSDEIFRKLENRFETPDRRKNSSIERACSYIQSHYNDSQMSLVTVSDHVSLNSTYLSDLFRKKMGKTFQDYLSEIRLGKAEYLLEHSSYSISEITEKVGFQSNSYFARFFRKSRGISPSEYRDQKKRP